MTVHGVGTYVPYKEFTCRENGKITKAYGIWAHMIERCYGSKDKKTYEGCTVADDWHRSDLFWSWAENQIGFLIDGYHLDKDILCTGNKQYNKDVCVFVPEKLNKFFCDARAIRGTLPQGIFYDKSRDKYVARVGTEFGYKFLGRYDDVSSAMKQYQHAKTEEGRNWVKRLSKHSHEVDERVIEFLQSYEFVYDKTEADSYTLLHGTT